MTNDFQRHPGIHSFGSTMLNLDEQQFELQYFKHVKAENAVFAEIETALRQLGHVGATS